MRKSFLKRLLACVLIFNIALLGMPTIGLAAPVGTHEVIQLQDRQDRIDRIQRVLLREDVAAALVAHGVPPQAARERVTTLTDEELQMLEQRIDELPAGGNTLLVVLGVVFVVLIVLDLLGVTNVFSRITR